LFLPKVTDRIRTLPAHFAIPSDLHSQVNDDTAIVSVAQCDESLVEEIEKRWSATVAIEDLNLEEIFLELHDAQ